MVTLVTNSRDSPLEGANYGSDKGKEVKTTSLPLPQRLVPTTHHVLSGWKRDWLGCFHCWRDSQDSQAGMCANKFAVSSASDATTRISVQHGFRPAQYEIRQLFALAGIAVVSIPVLFDNVCVSGFAQSLCERMVGVSKSIVSGNYQDRSGSNGGHEVEQIQFSPVVANFAGEC
jgi:hypothetical protein